MQNQTQLFLVPTPIGNLEDITFRAISVLKSSDMILAENTRQTKKLLNHYNIKTPLKSFHQYNEHKNTKKWIQYLQTNKILSVVSDAGTPGISDPGFLLVRESIKNNIKVETLPGATAFVPAIVNSGIPCDRFIFEGFLPRKKGRLTKIKELSQEFKTIIIYESPYRVYKTIFQFSKFVDPQRKISISREISKIYEETIRCTIEEFIKKYKDIKFKGEIVVVIQGKTD